MTCKQCDHPMRWHGDRAIGACDGGWNSVTAVARLRMGERNQPVSLCGCTGWVS